MELEKFISETIKQIGNGLQQGSSYIQSNCEGQGVEEGRIELAFDIAVASSDEDKTGLGGKITVASIFNAGAETQNTNINTNYSRVQFKVHFYVKTDGLK